MPLFKGKVLVTGATGIIGTAIALEIVKAGFAVRGTSRSQKRADAWSKKYPDAHVEWFIIEDQKTLGVYDEAVRGCDAICHVAGPFTFDHKTPEEIMDAQRNGTISILEAAVKEPTIKRIVYTSTVAAINEDPHQGTGYGKTYTEEDWNSTTWDKGMASNVELDPATSYCCGKTISEKLAWQFMAERTPHFDLVALCPATCYGPPMQVLDSLKDLDTASSRLWKHISHALEHTPVDTSPIFTHVQDTADATLKALTWPSAGGQRYQIVSGAYSYGRIFAILKRAFPEQAHRFPNVPNEGLPLKPVFIADCSKAERDLSMRWRSLEEAMVEEAKMLFELEGN